MSDPHRPTMHTGSFGIIHNEPLVERTCECGAKERTRSRTWKRCRKCAEKRQHQKVKR